MGDADLDVVFVVVFLIIVRLSNLLYTSQRAFLFFT